MEKKTRKRRIDEVVEDIEETEEDFSSNSSSHYLNMDKLCPTGLSELNLYSSGNVNGGLPAGSLIHIVGDSDSGKTLLTTTAMAEAVNNPAFDKYKILYIPAEGGFGFNVEYLFGKKLADRLEIRELPEYTKKVGANKTKYEFHNTVESWKKETVQWMRDNPCIIVTDSIDGLTCEDWLVSDSKIEDGKDAGGSMGMEKAKAIHQALLKIRTAARKSGSIVFYISQMKDNLDFGFGNINYSGGRGLKFFCDLQLAISSGGEDFFRTVGGVPHKWASQTKVKILKNHINGKGGTVYFRIVHNYGIDDLYGVVFFLTTYRWRPGSKTCTPAEIGSKVKAYATSASKGDKEKAVQAIITDVEANNKFRKIRKLMQQTFHAIEEKLTPKRKRRFE